MLLGSARVGSVRRLAIRQATKPRRTGPCLHSWNATFTRKERRADGTRLRQCGRGRILRLRRRARASRSGPGSARCRHSTRSSMRTFRELPGKSGMLLLTLAGADLASNEMGALAALGRSHGRSVTLGSHRGSHRGSAACFSLPVLFKTEKGGPANKASAGPVWLQSGGMSSQRGRSAACGRHFQGGVVSPISFPQMASGHPPGPFQAPASAMSSS
jgi:hypothetical protein